jgi:hypothetical protein
VLTDSASSIGLGIIGLGIPDLGIDEEFAGFEPGYPAENAVAAV